MQVSVIGVTMEVANGLSIADLFEHLATFDGKVFEKYRGYPRMISVDAVGKYAVALFLTIKDHNRFMTMRTQENGKVIISPQEIEEGTQPVDFNFLAVHEDTGVGLYSRYHGSCGLGTFASFLGSAHKIVLRAKQLEAAEQAASDAGLEKPNARMLSEARKRVKGVFNLVEIYDQTQLDEFLAMLRRVTAIEFELDGLGGTKRSFRTFADSAAKTRFKISFKPDISVPGMRNKISEWVRKKNPEKVKVTGRIQDKIRSFNMFRPAAKEFGDFPFNSVAASKIDPSAFEKHVLLVDMIQIMEDNPEVFIESSVDREEDDDGEENVE